MVACWQRRFDWPARSRLVVGLGFVRGLAYSLASFVNWLGVDLSLVGAVLLKRRLFAGACELDSQTFGKKASGS